MYRRSLPGETAVWAKAVAGSATKEGRMVGVWVEVGAADSEAVWVEAMVVDVE